MSRNFTTKLRSSITQLSYLPQTFNLIWAASRNWTLAWIILLVFQGVLPAASVYLTRLVVNSVVQVVGKGISWESIQTILIPVGLMAGVLLLTEFLQGASEWIRTAQSELVQDYISGLVHKQSIAIDFGCYESSEYNDRLERAREGAGSRSLALLENTGTLLQNSITLFAVAAILIPYGFWLPIILVASAFPAFYVAFRLNLHQYQWSQRTTTDRRRLQYYELLLTSSWAAKELRLFNFGSYFQSAYQKLRRRLRNEQIKLIEQRTVSRLVAGFIALLVTSASLAWMGRQVLLGIITLGDLALFYQAFNQGQSIVKSLLGSLGQIYKNSLFVSNLFEFLKIKPKIVDPPQPLPIPSKLQQGINLRQVTFRYPGSEKPVLKNFNLTIPAGKIVAIVGDNGAGKSTLIKLLCRFYDPESGSIELDDNDIREYCVEAFRKLITVLFQDPLPYYVSVTDNIAMGDLSITPSQSEIEASARGAGIHDKIVRLRDGYDSMLGKWFPGGTDLSGGEWQRLALARAFLRKGEIIILDEPTSAMDPWAEHDWLDRFRKMANGRTAIVITHRFTLAIRADIIHVMRAGKIVESGSHDELLALGGLYAESWKSQMESHHEVSV
ncbi:ABC-type multidrug transport system, ATPase and permease component [Calothrix sp. PCC 7716]|nr:ABC-type multidrug transport system, ATPase and permease component [Calothrix sp. PCC 7716]